MAEGRKNQKKGRKREVLYPLTLFLFLLLLFFKAVTLQEVIGWGGGDNTLHVLAYRLEVVNFLQNFKSLPFWSPALSGGFPLASDPAAGAFCPLNWLFFTLLSPSAALNYFIFFHFLLAGFGLYSYLKYLNLPSLASLFGALSFVGSLYLLSTADNIAILAANAWTPLVFLFLEKIGEKMDAWKASLAGLAVAAQILAGYPQAALLTLFAVFSLFSYRFWLERERKIFPPFFFSLFIGTLLALPLIVSVLKLLPFTPRAQGFLEQALANSLSPLSALSFFFPGLFKGIPVSIGKDILYSGLPALFCFLVAVSQLFKSNWRVRFFTFLFFFSLLGSLGKYGGLYYLLGSIPGFNLFRVPEQFLLLTNLSGATLAAYGLAEFSSPKKESLALAGKRIFILIFFFFLLAFFASFLLKTLEPTLKTELLNLVKERVYGKPPHFYSLSYYFAKLKFIYQSFANRLSPFNPVTLIPFFSVLLLFASFLFYTKGKLKKEAFQKCATLLLLLEMLLIINFHQFIPGINSRVYNQTPEAINFLKKDSSLFRIYSWPARLKFGLLHEEEKKGGQPEKTYLFVSQNLLANFPLRYGVPTIQGVEALWFKRQEKLLNILESKDKMLSEKEKLANLAKMAKVLGALNVKYIVSPYQIKTPSFKKVFQKGKTYIYLNTFFLPRAYLVANYKVLPEGKILSYLTSQSFEPSQEVILEEKPAKFRPLKSKNPGKVRIETYRPNYLRIKVNALTNCFLFLSDSFYPGWEAKIDGRKVPLLQANYLFRAVPVKKGKHTIELFFQPEEAYLASRLSIATLLAISGVLLLNLKKRGR